MRVVSGGHARHCIASGARAVHDKALMHTRSSISTAVGAALLLTAAHARAAEWYADPAVVAGGDGSQGKPFSTIASAVAVMSRGDTLWLASGTFSEVVNVAKLPGTSGRTTFRALPSAKPVIDGTSGSSDAQFVVQTSVPDTTFQDLTVTGAVNGALGIQFYMADGGQVIDVTTTKMSSNAVTFYYSSQGLVTGCTLQGNIGGRKTTGTVVTDNEVYGSGAEGIGLYNGSTDCTIAHNVVHDNYSVNIYLDSISHSLVDGNLIYETDPGNDLEGIEFSDEHYSDLAAPVNSYNTVINNVVVGNNLGIVFWMSDEWPTQDLQNQSGLRYDVIANNTLIDNKGSFRWDASPAHVGTTIENNVVIATAGSSPTYLLDAKSANGITLDHDLWFAPDLAQPFLWVGDQSDHAGYVTTSGQGTGDVLVDPRMVNGCAIGGAAGGQRGADGGLAGDRRGRRAGGGDGRLPRCRASGREQRPRRVPVRRGRSGRWRRGHRRTAERRGQRWIDGRKHRSGRRRQRHGHERRCGCGCGCGWRGERIRQRLQRLERRLPVGSLGLVRSVGGRGDGGPGDRAPA